MIQISRTQNGYSLGKLEATGLPPLQSQTLLALASGLTQKAAAEVLGCKQPSIRNYTSTLLFKLNATNTVHAVANAFASGNLHVIKTLAVLLIAMHTSVAPYATDGTQQPLRPRSRPSVRTRRREENYTTYTL